MSILGNIIDAIFGTHLSTPVDIEPILDKAAAAKGNLDWRHSIVDLMKTLDVDSSLTARKALAKELGYSGSMQDTASMNIWLHEQVLAEVRKNGGTFPLEFS